MDFEWDVAKAQREDELREEYRETDLHGGVRGKYAAHYRAGTNLVLLAPDVAAAFPTDEAVNEALRSLMRATDSAAPSSPAVAEGS